MLIFKTQCCTSRRTSRNWEKKTEYNNMWNTVKGINCFSVTDRTKKLSVLGERALEYHVTKIVVKYFSHYRRREQRYVLWSDLVLLIIEGMLVLVPGLVDFLILFCFVTYLVS